MTSILDTPATARRVTPTGILVLPSTADRADWLEARRTGITATDIVKIVGSSKYGSAVDVYADKIGQPLTDDELGEAGEWGVELEDYVARRWAELNGYKVRRVGLIRNDTHPLQLASLDRLVAGHDDHRCGAEIKTRSAWVGEQWEDGVPDSVNVQVQWQLATSGLDHMHVAVLLGGQRLVEHTIHPDPTTQGWLLEQGAAVWDAVTRHEPPVVDPALITVDLLNRIYSDRAGVTTLDGGIVRQLLTEYADAGDGEKAFKDTKERIKVELLTALGDAEEAIDEHGVTLFTYRPQTSRSVDYKVLEAEWPAVYEAVVTAKSSRTFRPNAKAIAS